jgi:hypothetical protein
MPELGMSVLPGSVMTAHLRAAAAGLAEGTVGERAELSVGTAGELTAIIDNLVEGQRHIAASLSRLAAYTRDRGLDEALPEVFRASALASGFAADALAESRPLLRVVLDVTGEDTPL